MLHQIGVGALGPVFRTYEPTRDRLVAVKVFRLDVTPEQARALADELGRAAKAGLFHPSIVEPVDAGLEGTVAYRAEEYVAAESLDVAMRHYAPAALDKALPFITQLASAIDFARTAGVGHGALHPRDIFVTPDEARATGFGVVDALERLGLRAPVRRPYSPPERIAGQPWGTSADVFSLGVIAFELLTGRRPSGLGADMGPLTGATLGARERQIRDVLARAMHENPAERFSTALEFASELGRAAGQEITVATGSVAAGELDIPLNLPSVSAVAPVDVIIDVVNKDVIARDVLISEEHRPSAPLADPAVPAADLNAPIDAALIASASDSELHHEPPHVEPIASPGDSPREVARRVIAARKRQAKTAPKPELPAPLTLGLGLPDPTQEAEQEVAPRPPVAPLGLEAPVTAEDKEGKEDREREVEPIAVRQDIVKAEEKEDEPAAVEIEPAAALQDVLVAPMPVALFSTDRDDRRVELERDRAHADSSESADSGEASVKDADVDLRAAARDVAGMADVPLAREHQERVVAVDEFRARETANKAERLWPRAPERPAVDIDRPAMSKPSAIDPVDSEELPLLPEETANERSPLVMLPLAVALLVGLLLGFTAGYFVAGRDQSTQVAQSVPPSPALQTPGTSGQTPAKDFSDQAVVPSSPQSQAPPTPVASEQGARTPAVRPAAPESRARPAAAASARKPDAARATTGKLVVTSTPPQAGVTVNKRWRGRTPLTLDGMAFGRYDVRIVEPGYEVARQQVAISQTSPTGTMSATLKATKTAAAAPAATGKPAATTGQIYVDSRPRGARVSIDGKEHGVTPLTVPDQAPGAHVIRIELTDHAPFTQTETVKAGVTSRVTGSLERIR